MDLPFSVEMLKHRAGALEQTRLRCLCRECPLRSKEEQEEALAAKNNGPNAQAAINATSEIDNEDLLRDGTDMTMDEDAATLNDAENEDPLPLPTNANDMNDADEPVRDFLIDLWPHSRPWRFMIATIYLVHKLFHSPSLHPLHSQASTSSWCTTS